MMVKVCTQMYHKSNKDQDNDKEPQHVNGPKTNKIGDGLVYIGESAYINTRMAP